MARFALALAAAGLFAGPAAAAVIVDNPGNLFPNTFFPGQSFDTPTGGPWNQIRFNFFVGYLEPDPPDVLNPTAAGTLYLFGEPYTGTPAGLPSAAASSTQFVGSSTGVVAGVYQFAPGLTLQPQTTYYAYSDTSQRVAVDPFGNGFQGFVVAPTDSFGNSEGSFRYRVTGDVSAPPTSAVPEPATLAVFGVLAAGGAVAYRRRQAAA